jgi:hypothetical protein
MIRDIEPELYPDIYPIEHMPAVLNAFNAIVARELGCTFSKILARIAAF